MRKTLSEEKQQTQNASPAYILKVRGKEDEEKNEGNPYFFSQVASVVSHETKVFGTVGNIGLACRSRMSAMK